MGDDQEMTRTVKWEYGDPLELVWTAAAAQLGMRIERDPQVYVSWNGRDTLRVGDRESLDADDCLAQLVLHEICHALVAGPQRATAEDWGLVYDQADDERFEHAALRLQAALANEYGLREFLAATTDYRQYYDAIPAEPLADDGDSPVALAQAGWQRAADEPWRSTLHQALAATRAIALAVAPLVPPHSLWKRVH